LSKDYHPVYKIAKDGYQFVIVPRLEILPGEIVILGFRGICRKRITEHILHILKVFQVFVQPNGPVAGSGQFLPFQVKKFIGGDIIGQDIIAMCLKHNREDDAMENDIVFSDKMHQLCSTVLPEGLPVFSFPLCPLNGRGDIPYRGIKPDIQDFTLATSHRYRDTPVEVAGYGPGLQPVVYPGLTLPVYIGFPIGFMAFDDPFLQEVLITIEREVPVTGFPQDGYGSTQS